ncbi:MAG: hypothetical protein ACOY0T_34575 [Myxococcota bacterium]
MNERPSLRIRFAPVLLCCAALFCAEYAEADEPVVNEASDSVKTFAEAVKLFKAGNAEQALPLFERLASATQSPNAQLYVGYCLSELGRHREAHRAFSLTIQYALAQKDERYEATREAAQEQVLALNLRLAKLVLSFVETPPSLLVKVDGVLIDPSLLGSPLVLEPGEHHIAASADGVVPIERRETIEAGGSKTLTLSFSKPESKPVVMPKPVAARSDGGSSLRMLGFVSGGVAVAGLSVFVVTGLKTRSINNELANECPKGCADPEHLDLVGRGKSMQTVANVSLAVGAVGALASASLLYLGYRNTGSAEPSIAFHPGGMSLRYRGTF